MPVVFEDLKELKKELKLQFIYDHSLIIKRIEKLENKIKNLEKKLKKNN